MTKNQRARKSRFQTGDTFYFEFASVMLQNRTEKFRKKYKEYYECNDTDINVCAHSMHLRDATSMWFSWFVESARAHLMRFFHFRCKRFCFYKFWSSLFPFLYYFRFYIISVSKMTISSISVSVNVGSVISISVLVSVTEISLVCSKQIQRFIHCRQNGLITGVIFQNSTSKSSWLVMTSIWNHYCQGQIWTWEQIAVKQPQVPSHCCSFAPVPTVVFRLIRRYCCTSQSADSSVMTAFTARFCLIIVKCPWNSFDVTVMCHSNLRLCF